MKHLNWKHIGASTITLLLAAIVAPAQAQSQPSCEELTNATTQNREAIINVCSEEGSRNFIVGNHDAAFTQMQIVTDLATDAFGVNHETTSKYRLLLVKFALAANEDKIAEGYLEQQLASLESASQQNTSEYTNTLIDMALVKKRLGDLESAELFAKSAFAAEEGTEEPDQLSLARAHMIYGQTLGLKGDKVSAIQHLQRALKIFKETGTDERRLQPLKDELAELEAKTNN